MPNDADVLKEAVRIHGDAANAFVSDVIPIIRDVLSLNRIMAALPAQQQARVARYLSETYGEHKGPAELFDWGVRMGIWEDERERLRYHEAWVDHARRVAIPAIRQWLAEHPGTF